MPGTFSVLEAPALLLKASLSTLLPLRDGAESEMVYPLGRRPLGERGQLEGKGPSGCTGPRPWLSSPGADQEAPAPSRIPDCDRALASGLSRPTSVLSPGSPSMSCRVCSSGEELDLLRGWEGWKESSTEGRAPSEETARSMGIPPAASSSAGYFSSWLELEDDCQEGGHRTSVRRDQRAHPGVHLEAMKPPPIPQSGPQSPSAASRQFHPLPPDGIYQCPTLSSGAQRPPNQRTPTTNSYHPTGPTGKPQAVHAGQPGRISSHFLDDRRGDKRLNKVLS